jgi:hypothetical protein
VFFCMVEVIIGTVLYINCCTDGSTITLNLWRLDNVNFHFCERAYGLEYGSSGEVSVRLLVYCVV